MNKKAFDIPNYESFGIYAIMNVRKMFCYIGSSKNIKARAINHQNDLRIGRHANKFLQEDFNNGDRLDFIILEKMQSDIDKDFLIAKEKMYMLTALNNSLGIYNLIPNTNHKEQREWIETHLLWYFMGKFNTKEILINVFTEKYSVSPAYMKNRKENNRI